MIKYYTAVVRCSTCKKELKRLLHVSENKTPIVESLAPLSAICDEKEHNIFSVYNWNVTIEWEDETKKLIKKEA